MKRQYQNGHRRALQAPKISNLASANDALLLSKGLIQSTQTRKKRKVKLEAWMAEGWNIQDECHAASRHTLNPANSPLTGFKVYSPTYSRSLRI